MKRVLGSVFAIVLFGCSPAQQEGAPSAPSSPAPSTTGAAPTATAATSTASTATTSAPVTSSSAQPGPTNATGLTKEMLDLLSKIEKQSPAIFDWPAEKIQKELGPEKQIKILPRLGSGRDIELQVQTGKNSDKPLLTRDLAAALNVRDPKVHQQPVTDGPQFRLAEGTSDAVKFGTLVLDIDISAGDIKTSGINLKGPGNFFDMSATSEVIYVMVAAPKK